MFFMECLRGFAIAVSNQGSHQFTMRHSSELRPMATANLPEDRQPLMSETVNYD